MKKRRILSALLAFITAAGTAIGAAGMTSAADTSPYKDVKTSWWSYPYVMYATEHGYMNGMGGGKFEPQGTMTRAMVVTVLYRIQGEPTVKSKVGFKDVKAGAWYADAVYWASEKGIVNGVEAGKFAPEDSITRQQLAAILMRYAPQEFIKTEDRKDITGYSDYKKVQAYARDAMSWTNAVGLITGVTKKTLEPGSFATREQFATILKRFKEDAEFDYEFVYNTPKYSTDLDRTVELVTDADIYVAVDGDDSNPGTLAKPIATFARAKEMVRELKKTAKDEIVVAFKAGNYGSLEKLEFTAEDSGTADVPITYTAYGDGEVIFENGLKIKNDEFKPIEESDKYLFKEKNYNNIYKVNLEGRIDEITNKSSLFSGNGACYEARYPNKDGQADCFFKNMTTTVDEYCSIELQYLLPKVVEGFRTTEGMRVTGHLRTGYLIDTFNVKSYDPETHVLTFDTYAGYVPDNGWIVGDSAGGHSFMYEGRTDDTVYFSNLSDQLDCEGEYWFDVPAKTLYVYAPNGDYTIADGGGFLKLNDADHISFVGLGFDGCAATAVESYSSDNVTFDRVQLSNISGKYAIYETSGKNFSVINSELYNFAMYGMYLTDAKANEYAIESDNLLIDNNYFHDFGFLDSWASAIEIELKFDSKVSHNVFKNGAHGAMRYNRCIDLVIEYNVFDTMMMTTADFGAIYATWREYAYRSNYIRYNIFMNIRAADGQYGVYVDGSCGQEVTNNLFYNAGNHAVTLGGGRDNIIADNVIINYDHYGDFLLFNNDMGGFIYNKREDPTYTFEQWDLYDKQLYVRAELAAIPQEGDEWYEEWHRRWPILYSYNFDYDRLGELECYYSTFNYIRDNIAIGKQLTDKFEWYDPYAIGKETNVLHATDYDLGFKDPTHGDYTPLEGSGIDIPVAEIGLRG